MTGEVEKTRLGQGLRELSDGDQPVRGAVRSPGCWAEGVGATEGFALLTSFCSLSRNVSSSGGLRALEHGR